MTLPAETLKQLLIAYLAMGKSAFSDTQLEDLHRNSLPHYLSLASEAVPLSALVDKSLINQALHSLAAGNSAEETVMYSFMLYIYTLVKSGKVHPLEMGIIRQKVQGILPVFERAASQARIGSEVFDTNATLLLAIAEQTPEAHEAIEVLASGYAKYA